MKITKMLEADFKNKSLWINTIFYNSFQSIYTKNLSEFVVVLNIKF